MQKVSLSICNMEGKLNITMRLIADLEAILGHKNFLQFHHDLCNLDQSELPMHKLLDAGEYLLQKLGYDAQAAAVTIDDATCDATKDILLALSHIMQQYADSLPKSGKSKKSHKALEPTPWEDYYRVSCGMMGWSEEDLMNASPKTVFEAIEGFKQFHGSSDKTTKDKDPQSLIDSFESR